MNSEKSFLKFAKRAIDHKLYSISINEKIIKRLILALEPTIKKTHRTLCDKMGLKCHYLSSNPSFDIDINIDKIINNPRNVSFFSISKLIDGIPFNDVMFSIVTKIGKYFNFLPNGCPRLIYFSQLYDKYESIDKFNTAHKVIQTLRDNAGQPYNISMKHTKKYLNEDLKFIMNLVLNLRAPIQLQINVNTPVITKDFNVTVNVSVLTDSNENIFYFFHEFEWFMDFAGKTIISSIFENQPFDNYNSVINNIFALPNEMYRNMIYITDCIKTNSLIDSTNNVTFLSPTLLNVIFEKELAKKIENLYNKFMQEFQAGIKDYEMINKFFI